MRISAAELIWVNVPKPFSLTSIKHEPRNQSQFKTRLGRKSVLQLLKTGENEENSTIFGEKLIEMM